MMIKTMKVFSVLMIIATAMVMLVACSGKSQVVFKVEFMVDNAVYSTLSTNGEEVIQMPEDPIKGGYYFDGWYWDNESWLQPFTANSLLNAPLSDNMKVYAKWNDENSLEGAQAKFDAFTNNKCHTYSLVVANTVSVFDFNDNVEVNSKSSWKLSTDVEGVNTIPNKMSSLVAGDNTYYVAVTSENGSIRTYTLQIRRRPLYQVTFENTGTSTIPNQNIEEGQLATKPNDPSRVGYTFDCWNFDFNTAITSSETVRASWRANTYKITYHANSGTSDKEEQDTVFNANVTLKSGATFTLIDEYRQYTYELIGWNTQADGKGTVYSLDQAIVNYSIADDLTLYAVWDRTEIEYSITYELNDGAFTEEQQLKYTTMSVFDISDPSKRGYDFVGWYLDSDLKNSIEGVLGEKGDGVTMVALSAYENGNVTLHAKFTTISYGIIYNTNNGINHENNPTNYNIETDTLTLQNANKTGYTFGGWFANSGLTGQAITTINKGSIGEVELWAQWIINQYTMIFDTNGGDTIEPITDDYDATIYVMPTRTGHAFVKWTLNGNDYTIATMPAESITVVAIWQVNQYTMTFNVNGGNALAPITDDYGATITVNPTREGYHFIKWTLNGKDYTITTMPAENINLSAVWSVNTYKIVFDSNTGSNIADIIYDFGQVTMPPTNPTKSGFTFTGWFIDAEYENLHIFANMPAYDITLYAKWTATLTFAYRIAGSNVGQETTKTVVYGQKIGTLPLPFATDCIFGGWWTLVGGDGEEYTDSTLPNGNITLWAKWSTLLYFDTKGSDVIEPIMIVCERPIAVSDFPMATTELTKEGYTNDGYWWDGGIGYGYNTNYPASIGQIGNVLEIRWVGNPYHIIFDLQGGECYTLFGNTYPLTVIPVNGTNVVYGQKIGVGISYEYLNNNENKHYLLKSSNIFAGWFTEVDGGGVEYTAETVYLDTTDITLYANWLPLS